MFTYSMKPGRRRLRMYVLYKKSVRSSPVEGSCLWREQRWTPWSAQLEFLGDRGLEEDFCWESVLNLGMWGSKSMGSHLHEMAEKLGAFMHAKDEVWSHQGAQGLGRLEANHINWGQVQQGGFYESVVYTLCSNLNSSSELVPHPFHCVDWEI